MTILEAAKKLAKDKTIIESYTDFDTRRRYWVFSTNTSFSSLYRVNRPPEIPKDQERIKIWWRSLENNQKRVLYLSESRLSLPSILPDRDISSVREVYEKWKLGYVVLYYGVEGYSCNQFVGEAIYMAGKNLMSGNKYFSARNIWEAKTPLRRVDKENVLPGDIAAFGGTHVEIVTKVEGNSFCSVGAGRGPSHSFGLWSGNGEEVCGWEFMAKNRYIDSDDIKFRRVE